ncbi:MAG: dTDP-4-dehydrorhamnose reductase [Burkholderiales bacterium]
MKILLIGKNGQVGRELERALAPLGELTACDRAALDLGKPEQIVSAIRAAKPEVIVNAAAYTAVDKAESEPELAIAVNARAPGILAEEATRHGALLVHYSTDYVFDGTKKGAYTEEDKPDPPNVYGMSKLEGERAIQSSDCRHLIFRTSWVYAPAGKNFLLTILRLAREKPELRVVDDQTGAPTSARMIAEATAACLRTVAAGKSPASGVYHMSAAGQTTWCGFARAIVAAAGLPTKIVPIGTKDYPTAAGRPSNSLLDNTRLFDTFGVRLPAWEDGLAQVLAELEKSGAAI